ncbi:hypothetical protein AMAG_14752 [Allomyces macrogynus ATCC 38327]|uniref:Hsp70-like protein n=1 Tax=Allomyces macrogynus (strain ATCC 38327) TaxID=578462 RepID=A0A0L0T5R0_ALLM3|nr:hypothetical protein AMAG_14752 [Allomyces macrogynus ATCC 38327]|eukprot:KNE69904.1 hypothetical protein AMAG_14752 [Allomyces macrogynus ATCC 38327]
MSFMKLFKKEKKGKDRGRAVVDTTSPAMPTQTPVIPQTLPHHRILATDVPVSKVAGHGSSSDLPRVRYMVGIDFGTTFSGFAIHRVPNEMIGKNPRTSLARSDSSTQIIGNEDWADRPGDVHSHKVPTIIAYPHGERSSIDQCKWGWSAIQFNDTMTRIERIKLALESTTPEVMRPVVPDGMRPVDIISDYLACLRREMMHFIASHFPGDNDLSADDMLICMTVPVGWSSKAHHTIRCAATNAGLISNENSRHLLFCYEPEAAALACIHESSFEINHNPSLLIADCGGGTVDMFLARLDASKELEELTLGTGNFAGATSVDARFNMFLRSKIGMRAFHEYKRSLVRHYAKLEQEWESKKRTFSGTQDWLLQIPNALSKYFPANKVAELENLEILITAADMKSFFDPVVDEIINLICDQLEQARNLDGANKIEKVDYLYLVGGFGSNRYLQDRIKDNPGIKAMVGSVVLLQRPEAAVVRGAVWFCINSQSIRKRRARQTIGIGVQREFDPSRDLKSEITFRDPANPSRAFVSKAVLCFLAKGDPVSSNASYKKTGFRVPRDGQPSIDVNVFVSNEVPPSAKGMTNVPNPEPASK